MVLRIGLGLGLGLGLRFGLGMSFEESLPTQSFIYVELDNEAKARAIGCLFKQYGCLRRQSKARHVSHAL